MPKHNYTLIVILIFSSLAVLSKDIIVAKTGKKFSSISAAVATAKPGDRIRVKQGIYHETIVINTPSIRIEAFDPKQPPIIDGSDQQFVSGQHKWSLAKGKIYKTSYRWPNKRPTSKQFLCYLGGRVYAPLMVYEDGKLLRGYGNRHDKKYKGKGSQIDDTGKVMVFGEYIDLDDLDPRLTKGILPPPWIKQDIRIPGRFLYKENAGELYIWSAKENNPQKHTYNIPVLFNLIKINAPKVILSGLILQYSSAYAIVINNAADCVIENCIMENNYYPIFVKNCKNIIIRDNVIRQRGLYERYWYDDCKGTLLWSNAVNLDNLKSSGGKIYRNIISGFYICLRPASPGAKVFNNIISKALSGSINCTEVKNMPPRFRLDVSIYNNIFHHIDLQGVGVSFIENGPVYIYRNIFYAVKSMMKTGGQKANEIKGHTYFYHNTCAFSNSICDNPYLFAGGNVHSNNNIFHNNWYKFGQFHSWYRKNPKNFSYFPFTKGPKSDYNVYWTTGNKYSRMGIFGKTSIKTLSELQQKVGIDLHSHFINPKLQILKNYELNITELKVDYFSSMERKKIIETGYTTLFKKHFNNICANFALESGSPCINAGGKSIALDSTEVIKGKPDLGALEYGTATLLLK